MSHRAKTGSEMKVEWCAAAATGLAVGGNVDDDGHLALAQFVGCYIEAYPLHGPGADV